MGTDSKKYLHLILILLLFFSAQLSLSASSSKKGKIPPKKSSKNIKFAEPDTLLTVYKRGHDGLIEIPKEDWTPFGDNVTFADTVLIDPSFLPVVFDGEILPKNLNLVSPDSTFAQLDSSIMAPAFHLISPDSTFAPQLNKLNAIEDARRNFYTSYPEDISISTSQFSKYRRARKEEQEAIKKSSFFKAFIEAETIGEVAAPTVEKVVPKRVYWTYKGQHRLQIAQNAISHNWKDGGNSNYSVDSYQRLDANYKKDKLSFENMIEWRLLFQNAPGDTIHKVQLNDDYLRTYQKLSYEAFKNWGYSTTLELKTPVFRHFGWNSTTRNSAFLAPLEIRAGIGLSKNIDKTYKSDKYKKLHIGFDLQPISLYTRYVADKDVNVTQFGIEEGKRIKTDYGSTFNANMRYDFNRYIWYQSRLKYYTTYKSAYCEFENTFNMSINRYFSTTIYLYLVFDDSDPNKRDGGWGYLQRNERISFGLNYNW